jgi:hypothetical protein
LNQQFELLLETKKLLKDLQWRASLVGEEYREALLAHPDAIELPLEHLDAGHTYVAEEWLYVIANPRARGFYQASVFEQLGEEQTRFGSSLTKRKRVSAKSVKVPSSRG